MVLLRRVCFKSPSESLNFCGKVGSDFFEIKRESKRSLFTNQIGQFLAQLWGIRIFKRENLSLELQRSKNFFQFIFCLKK